jgi:hypothetical protein
LSRLITPSIVGAVEWARTAPNSDNHNGSTWKVQARVDLENQLGRVPWSEADSNKPSLVLGKKFEETLYAEACKEQVDGGSDHFRWFLSKVKGGTFQKVSKRFIEVDGVEYCLYGKLDVWFPEIIYDVKTTRRFKGIRAYLDSFQHVMYCYNENIMDFAYLVAEFEDKDEMPKILDHHEVKFHAEGRDALRDKVVETIRSFAAYINADEKLQTLYTTKFSRY